MTLVEVYPTEEATKVPPAVAERMATEALLRATGEPRLGVTSCSSPFANAAVPAGEGELVRVYPSRHTAPSHIHEAAEVCQELQASGTPRDEAGGSAFAFTNAAGT